MKIYPQNVVGSEHFHTHRWTQSIIWPQPFERPKLFSQDAARHLESVDNVKRLSQSLHRIANFLDSVSTS